MNDELKNMLEQRKQTLGFQKPSPAPAPGAPAGMHAECFGVSAPEGFSEHFLDLRYRDGTRVAFPYADLIVMSFDPDEARLDLNFRGYWVTLRGQSLDGNLYDCLRDCRVRWIAEAPENESARTANAAWVESIEVISPDDENSEPEEEAEDEQ